MKTMTKLIATILCLLMILSTLAACSESEEVPKITEEIKETAEISDTEEIEEPVIPVVLPEGCSWAIEPGKFRGDIRPLYDMWTDSIYNTGISLLSNDEGSFLIDQEGNIRTTLEGSNFDFCSYEECSAITNHFNTIVSPDDLTPIEKCTEHGGIGEPVFTYDKDTGDFYYAGPSKYVLVRDDLEYAVAKISTSQPLDDEEKEYYNIDHKYECSDGFGLVVNGKLAASGYEMYSVYNCGVVALKQNGKWGYFDTEGNEIFPCEYEAHYDSSLDFNSQTHTVPFHATEGILVLTRDGKSAYADVEGNMLTDFIFDGATPVYNNKAWVKTSEGWGVVIFDHNYTNTTENSDFMANAVNTVQDHIYE